MKYGQMMFNHHRDSWVVEMNGYQYTLFCGEVFELVIGELKVPCRLELEIDWYIITEGDVKFDLRICEHYDIYI